MEQQQLQEVTEGGENWVVVAQEVEVETSAPGEMANMVMVDPTGATSSVPVPSYPTAEAWPISSETDQRNLNPHAGARMNLPRDTRFLSPLYEEPSSTLTAPPSETSWGVVVFTPDTSTRFVRSIGVQTESVGIVSQPPGQRGTPVPPRPIPARPCNCRTHSPIDNRESVIRQRSAGPARYIQGEPANPLPPPPSYGPVNYGSSELQRYHQDLINLFEIDGMRRDQGLPSRSQAYNYQWGNYYGDSNAGTGGQNQRKQ